MIETKYTQNTLGIYIIYRNLIPISFAVCLPECVIITQKTPGRGRWQLISICERIFLSLQSLFSHRDRPYFIHTALQVEAGRETKILFTVVTAVMQRQTWHTLHCMQFAVQRRKVVEEQGSILTCPNRQDTNFPGISNFFYTLIKETYEL